MAHDDDVVERLARVIYDNAVPSGSMTFDVTSDYYRERSRATARAALAFARANIPAILGMTDAEMVNAFLEKYHGRDLLQSIRLRMWNEISEAFRGLGILPPPPPPPQKTPGEDAMEKIQARYKELCGETCYRKAMEQAVREYFDAQAKGAK